MKFFPGIEIINLVQQSFAFHRLGSFHLPHFFFQQFLFPLQLLRHIIQQIGEFLLRNFILALHSMFRLLPLAQHRQLLALHKIHVSNITSPSLFPGMMHLFPRNPPVHGTYLMAMLHSRQRPLQLLFHERPCRVDDVLFSVHTFPAVRASLYTVAIFIIVVDVRVTIAVDPVVIIELVITPFIRVRIFATSFDHVNIAAAGDAFETATAITYDTISPRTAVGTTIIRPVQMTTRRSQSFPSRIFRTFQTTPSQGVFPLGFGLQVGFGFDVVADYRCG
mmetsp:Transcript_34627/g.74878  ORF Transcript_34627/g.74878 Transcript_34627/m.74878 type:complete len:277 (+) Transcript_34627:1672-2502(+)